MYLKTTSFVKIEDLNIGSLGLKNWQNLTPAQWHERMEDMHWMLEMLYCARALGGLEHLDWEVAKTMTFPQYMEAVKAKATANAG